MSIYSVSSMTKGSSPHYGAEHYHLFVHNVFPYETIFLGDDGLLGGIITENVNAFYQRIGFQPDMDESADHISAELNAMAHLCFAEYDAIEDQIPHEIQRLRQLQRYFLDNHLLRWLPVFCIAIQQQEHNVYAEVVFQSFELVCNHRVYLGDDLMANGRQFELAMPPELLANEKTSLRDIASYLLTPAYTGFFLSNNDIKRIGSILRIPHGFGKRQQILTNLLRTASDYELFSEILSAFREQASDWQEQLFRMSTLPTHIQTIWVNRLQNTIKVLNEIDKLALARDQNILIDDSEIDHSRKC